MSEPRSEFALQLNEALSDPALAEFNGLANERLSQEARLAAYAIAAALGRCRLFGAEDADVVENVLTDRVAEAASSLFREFLRDWIIQANRLGELFDESESFEDIDHCADILHCQMETWAVFVALDEAYQESLELDGCLDASRSVWMNEVVDLIEQLDETLQSPENLQLLSVVTCWPLLDNLRATLGKPYCEVLPWWLDGILEATAEGNQRQITQDSMFQLKPTGGKDGLPRASEVLGDQHMPPLILSQKCISDQPLNTDQRQLCAESIEVYPDSRQAKPIKRRYARDAEFALPASDTSSDRATPAERRSIEYLCAHVPEILGHGGSNIWFDVDSSGTLIGHTYDPVAAATYSSKPLPHIIPWLFDPGKLFKPDVQNLLTWFTAELRLTRPAAEQICVNLGLRW